jgi:hypothetical protein
MECTRGHEGPSEGGFPPGAPWAGQAPSRAPGEHSLLAVARQVVVTQQQVHRFTPPFLLRMPAEKIRSLRTR